MCQRIADKNMWEIIRGLRKADCSVQETHMIGDGFPDLVVGIHGRNEIIEIKTPSGKLSRRQKKFHKYWKGSSIIVARSLEDALEKLGLFKALGLLEEYNHEHFTDYPESA